MLIRNERVYYMREKWVAIIFEDNNLSPETIDKVEVFIDENSYEDMLHSGIALNKYDKEFYNLIQNDRQR